MFVDQRNEIAPRLAFATPGGDPIDVSGLDSLKMRLQLGSADEMTLTLPARDMKNKWRSDMPVFNTGASINVSVGYNGVSEFIQSFEVVSTTDSYEDEGTEQLVVRGVSDLARAARCKKPRVSFAPLRVGADRAMIQTICDEFGWKNRCDEQMADPSSRVKENGKSDLELLRRIAVEARLGGPRITKDRELIMPAPTVGKLKYARGLPTTGGTGWRRLHSLGVNREGGQVTLRVAVIGFDPSYPREDGGKGDYVEVEFEADEFGGDPRIVYEGRLAHKGLLTETTTQGLILAAYEANGNPTTKYTKKNGPTTNERIDVIASGRFANETDAQSLAKRWFELREKLSRWADITVDGHIDLVPYESIEIDGQLSNMDRGVWLPITVEHNFNVSSGWMAQMRCIRVVNEPVIKPTEFSATGTQE